MSLIQIILIALIFVIVIGAGIAFYMNQEAERRKRVMMVVKGRSAGREGPDEKDVQNKRRAEIAKKLKEGREEDEKDNEANLPSTGTLSCAHDEWARFGRTGQGSSLHGRVS